MEEDPVAVKQPQTDPCWNFLSVTKNILAFHNNSHFCKIKISQ